MRRKARWSLLLLPVLLASFVVGRASFSQETQPAKEPPGATRVRGRLPAYFAAVVTQEQRMEIYRIQAPGSESDRQAPSTDCRAGDGAQQRSRCGTYG